jgi:hypothetical protein
MNLDSEVGFGFTIDLTRLGLGGGVMEKPFGDKVGLAWLKDNGSKDSLLRIFKFDCLTDTLAAHFFGFG